MNPTTSQANGAVVVAIDESDPSRAALTWAANYARNIGAELRAVHVLRYDFGAPLAWTPGLRGAPRTVSEPEIELTEASLRDLFDSILPEPSWTLSFLEGPAGHEIVDYAQHAQLLVIGTREHRGLDRLMVGSLSHYCLSHAVCPIVAVPPTPVKETEGRHESGVPAQGGQTLTRPVARLSPA
jgi:nucleotide-binding universal stress UspA family protein